MKADVQSIPKMWQFSRFIYRFWAIVIGCLVKGNENDLKKSQQSSVHLKDGSWLYWPGRKSWSSQLCSSVIGRCQITQRTQTKPGPSRLHMKCNCKDSKRTKKFFSYLTLYYKHNWKPWENTTIQNFNFYFRDAIQRKGLGSSKTGNFSRKH